jgi:hypothetical protein
VKERVPERVPVAEGVNVTLTTQLDPDARLAEQLLVSEKSPVVETLLIVSGWGPTSVIVTLCAVLVVPCIWLPKVRLPGEVNACGVVIATAVPVDDVGSSVANWRART